MEPKTSRREFIKGVSATIMMSAVPVTIGNGHLLGHIDQENILNHMIRAFIEDQERWSAHEPSYGWTKECGRDIEHNLTDAFGIINPKTYDEYVLVGACAWGATCPYAAEYVQRKAGKPSVLPDHPIFSLDWSITSDTQRLLVFRDQIDALLNVIMRPASKKERPYRKQFLREEISFNRFYDRLEDRYRQELTQGEQKQIYEGLVYYTPNSQPYFWCSSRVNLALKRADNV